MNPPAAHPAGAPGSPIGWSEVLGRRIRQDDLSTLGISTQTLAEQALDRGEWELAAELVGDFADELRIMNGILFTWLSDILDHRVNRAAPIEAGLGVTLLAGFRAFDPGKGDQERALGRIRAGDVAGATADIELMRVRWAAQHDGLVVWIQELLTEIARPLTDRAGISPDAGGAAATPAHGGLRPAGPPVPLVHRQGRDEAPPRPPRAAGLRGPVGRPLMPSRSGATMLDQRLALAGYRPSWRV